MGIRLLIADDNEWVREGLRYAFSNTQVNIVAEATNGNEAVRIALEEDIDVILLDLQMPGVNGFEALRQIKAVKSHMPTLIYSAHDRSDTIQQCEALGAHSFLQKGKDEALLVRSICEAFAAKTICGSKPPE